jgi:hypothetical protein
MAGLYPGKLAISRLTWATSVVRKAFASRSEFATLSQQLGKLALHPSAWIPFNAFLDKAPTSGQGLVSFTAAFALGSFNRESE